jgi:hypothetical protein
MTVKFCTQRPVDLTTPNDERQRYKRQSKLRLISIDIIRKVVMAAIEIPTDFINARKISFELWRLRSHYNVSIIRWRR